VGDSETVAYAIQAMTGLRLQPGGSVEILDRTAWQKAVNKSQMVDPSR
jgi:hypothetical protein